MVLVGGRCSREEIDKAMAIGQIKQKQTPEVLNKLEQAFAIGATNAEACFFAGIAESTYYVWCNQNPELLELHKGLKSKPVLKARQEIVNAIDQGDIATAKWYLERQRKAEFSTQVNSEVTNREKPLTHIESEYVQP